MIWANVWPFVSPIRHRVHDRNGRLGKHRTVRSKVTVFQYQHCLLRKLIPEYHKSYFSSSWDKIQLYPSLRASSPIWASEASLARTRERHVCGDSFHALRSPGVSGVEMKIYERSLQALLSSAPSLARSREAHFAYPNRRACSQANFIRM